jgi:hypothetical protein
MIPVDNNHVDNTSRCNLKELPVNVLTKTILELKRIRRKYLDSVRRDPSAMQSIAVNRDSNT